MGDHKVVCAEVGDFLRNVSLTRHSASFNKHHVRVSNAVGLAVCPPLWVAPEKSFWTSALSLEEGSKLKSKNAHCKQETEQERSFGANTPGELMRKETLEQADKLGGVWEKNKTGERSLDKDVEGRMSWAYLYEPKY